MGSSNKKKREREQRLSDVLRDRVELGADSYRVVARVDASGRLACTECPSDMFAAMLGAVFGLGIAGGGLWLGVGFRWDGFTIGMTLLGLAVAVALFVAARYARQFKRVLTIDAAANDVVYSVRSPHGSVEFRFPLRSVRLVNYPYRGTFPLTGGARILIAWMPGRRTAPICVKTSSRGMDSWIQANREVLGLPVSLGHRDQWHVRPGMMWWRMRHSDYDLPRLARYSAICHKCGYALQGLARRSRCPECGEVPPSFPPGSSTMLAP